MSNESKDAFLVGLIMGVFFLGMASSYLGTYAQIPLSKKMEACQAELPRSQTCVLIAVPKDK